MLKPLTFTYKTVDNVKLDLDVWLPERHSESKALQHRPALVWFHGGGGFSGDKSPDLARWFPFWVRGKPKCFHPLGNTFKAIPKIL